MASTQVVWVAYVTSGREKYEYETEFVGVFATEALACEALFQHLVKTKRIFSPELRRDNPEAHDVFVGAQQLRKTPKDLVWYCEKFDDSFWGDGWSFMVVSQPVVGLFVPTIQNSLVGSGNTFKKP